MRIIELFTGAYFHISFDSSSVRILNYYENQFIDSLLGGNFYIDHERFQAFQLSNIHPQIPGYYQFGELEVLVSDNVSPGIDIVLQLVSGTYYPSGFGNYSIPTYFIQPVLIDGVIHVVTSGLEEERLPDLPEIHLTNYPNPFNASTIIKFELKNDSHVGLSIYDLLGREVDRLASEFMSSGRHEIAWDGSAYPSGIYFYRLETADGSYNRRMTLLK
jgi:hypothetical protein